MKNVIAVITGLTGSGKTWLLSRLFNKQPPEHYTSTGVFEQSLRGLLHHIGNMSLRSWRPFSHRNMLEFLASILHAGMPPADVMDLAAKVFNDDLQDSATISSPPHNATSPRSLVSKSVSAAPDTFTTPLKSATGKSMVKFVKAPKKYKSLSILELVHMIDTGGQPEFMEFMPSVISGCHLAVLVLNLMFSLDECPPIHFHECGKAYKRVLTFQHTSRQIIQKLASTLQAKRFSQKEKQCFRILVVATHRDCVQGDILLARLQALDEALRNILLPGSSDELIVFSSDRIPFVLNLKNPNSQDNLALQLIREKVSESGVGEGIEVPGTFLVFEQDILKFSVQVGRDILSLEECLTIGYKLKMKAEVVMAALHFFHRQITFLYFRHVLPNVVFTKPQVPLDIVNAVVLFSYKVGLGIIKGFPAKLTAHLKDGIITEEMLNNTHLSKYFIPNLYEPYHAIKLFIHNLTIAPLSQNPQTKTSKQQAVDPTNPKREYLMMSLLPTVPEEAIHQFIPTSVVVPLVANFSQDCIPLSCFSSTISCLLSLFNWKLCRKEGGFPECLFHNIVSLYDPQLPVQVLLADLTNHLEIHIYAEKDVSQKILSAACFHIRETVFSAIAEVFNIMQLAKINVSPAFLCPCSQVTVVHCASVHTFKSERFLRCSKREVSVGSVQEQHTFWLDPPISELDTPTLPTLLRFKIHKKVGVNYREFGIFLLKDDTGCRVDAIVLECHGRSDHITMRILQEWLEGKGVLPTWQSLVNVLHDCELNVLADQIKKEKLTE